MNPIARFAKNILLSVDQFGNVLLLGSADETISARSYREGQLNNKTSWKAMRWFVDKLFWFEPNHTEQAYWAEQSRCHMPEEYRPHTEIGDAAATACELPTLEKTNETDA